MRRWELAALALLAAALLGLFLLIRRAGPRERPAPVGALFVSAKGAVETCIV